MERDESGQTAPSETSASRPATAARFADWVRRQARNLAPLATLVLMVTFFAVTTDSFLNLVNLRNILAQVATLAVVATGVTFVLLCGEIDLSIASVAMMTGVISSMLFGVAGLPDTVSLIAGLLAAAALGALNGVTTTRVGLPSFVATLATMQIASGLAQNFTRGNIIYTIPPVLKYLGGAYIGAKEPLRIPVVVLAGIVS